MTKSILTAPILLALLLGPVACDEGYDTVDAQDECDRIRRDFQTCFDDSVDPGLDPTFQACVSCFETCGNECYVETCTFTCAD